MATDLLSSSGPPRLRDYPADVGTGDLFRDAAPEIAAKWVAMADGLAAQAAEAGVPAVELVARQITDLGMSFRLTGDLDERPWPLTPMPLIVGAAEWAGVEQGLIQRARLLEAVAADLYGPQTLVSGGHLPAALVTGSRYFARNMVGRSGRQEPFVHVYACDLARGPHGQWRVLGDRLRMANGIGYALENRLALSRSTGALLGDIHARRLATFFSDLRAGIARTCQRESPRIALLTPGRLNQSYPEQAHLARYLGVPLVEGRDLTVSDDRLYVRTIAGPKRIDALWRWIDTTALDPLNFDPRSEIGVPDLCDAWGQGGLAIANRPGVEILEAPAFAAFLPRLCSVLLDEAPILPNVATWWCGQPREAETVRERLAELVLTPAFGIPVEGLRGGTPVPGAGLAREAREALLAALARRPMDYCGQEIIQLSTTPALIDERFVPRPFTLRAFVARDAAGEWTVMPGGFGRLAAAGGIATTLIGAGDLSADLCVVDAVEPTEPARTLLAATPAVRRGGGILASQAADNLFWFGRYVERTEATLRVIRAALGAGIEVDAASGGMAGMRERLVGLLAEWDAIAPSPPDGPAVPHACHQALTEASLPGGVVTLFTAIRTIGLALRDRLAPDFWRIASRPVPRVDSSRPGALLRVTRELLERVSALSGLLAENFVHGPAWRFIDMGRRLERALALCTAVPLFAGDEESPEALGVLLDLSDSQITYRARYLSAPRRTPVLDLLVLDPDNPRSLAYQLDALVTHIAALPTLDDRQLPEPPLLQARALQAPIACQTAERLGMDMLLATQDALETLSNAIAERYFLQVEKRGGGSGAGMLLA